MQSILDQSLRMQGQVGTKECTEQEGHEKAKKSHKKKSKEQEQEKSILRLGRVALKSPDG